MITTVLLDAGGVILDESAHENKQAEIITEIIAEQVLEYSVDLYWRDVGEAVRLYCPNVYQYVLWKNLKPDTGRFATAARKHEARWQQERPPLVLMAGLADELKSLSETLKIGIAGQYGREILDLLRDKSLLELFTYHVTQDDFEVTKPDPRYYEQICERIEVDPRSCVMVGDRIDKDIIPAKQMGMKTVRIRGGLHRDQESRTPDEVPDVELTSLIGLADAIGAMAAGE